MTPFTLLVYDWIFEKVTATKQLCRPILTVSPTHRMPRGSEPRAYHAPSNCVAPPWEPGHPETLDLPTRVSVDCTSSRRCQVHFLVVQKLTVVTSFLLRNYRFFLSLSPPPPKSFPYFPVLSFTLVGSGWGPHLLHIYSLGTFLCPFLLAVSI